MIQGNKCDGDTWKPQALQVVVIYLNRKFHLDLTKDNIKNKLKYWKQSGFLWDEERKMIVVTSDERSSWVAYVESHPDAKGMQNKMIEQWYSIVLLCGKDRAIDQGTETFEEGAELMVEGDENEVNPSPLSGQRPRARPSSSTNFMQNKKKRPKKDSFAKAVSVIATSKLFES
ncbi:hypothetical protein PHJA_001071600 [Phtheirospermum japonicum]|uniref:Myb/SANT-like domain-containing protein n=1 Tax=Phtheirospermum japonicum TaxID=374723 RepID=A0A830BT94_9LAMI|nr:hypothetical protein PHJA_001071600 [Phtheirospermum japonicum]